MSPSRPPADTAPRQTSDLCGGRVLVFATHPDDESLACGGAIALHRQRHDPVKVVVVTDGGHWIWSSGPAPADYAERRRQEVEDACAVLGVEDLELWGLPDGQLDRVTDLADRIAAKLISLRPDLVYAPPPEDCHGDHRAVSRALWQAVQDTGVQPKIAFHDFSLPLAVNTLVDISSVIEVKRRACDCHRSQLEHLAYTDIALALNRYRSYTVAATCDWAEGYLVVDPASFHQWRGHQMQPWPPTKPLGGDGQGAPQVSVIVRTKNRPQLLGQALASLRAQTWRQIEVVVVNDGGCSIDAVLEEEASGLDLKVVEISESAGRSAAGNRGASEASGRYLAFLDDDDLLHPNHVDRLVRHLQRVEPAVVYSDTEIGAYERVGDQVAIVAEPRPYPVHDFDADWLHVRNYIPLNSALFPRDEWTRHGGFDESLDALEDWDLWLRMAGRLPFYRIEGVSATIRVFADHRHDFISAMTQVYAKHQDYWTPTNLAERIWPRVQRLEHRAISAIGEEPAAGPVHIALRLLLRVIPVRLKHWLNCRLQAYRRW